MNSWKMCKEISINRDCVWGVFETTSTVEVDQVTDVAAMFNSMIRILNYKLRKKWIPLWQRAARAGIPKATKK